MKEKIEIPEWLAKLPRDAGVNIKEFAQILGFKVNTIRDYSSRSKR